jgi:hypothetical protein
MLAQYNQSIAVKNNLKYTEYIFLEKKKHYAFLFTHACSSYEQLIIHNLYILPIGENCISVVLPSVVLLKNVI